MEKLQTDTQHKLTVIHSFNALHIKAQILNLDMKNVIVDRNRAASNTSIACSAHISAAVIAIHLSMTSY